jgi:hypothetical protein
MCKASIKNIGLVGAEFVLLDQFFDDCCGIGVGGVT